MKKLIILLSMFTILAAGCGTINNTSADNNQSIPIQENLNTESSSEFSGTSSSETSDINSSESSSTNSSGSS
ncbi:MAG: hypothetical protein K2N56_12755, partial [Oscillospiraceae bacterium]|nr:hypothetical protein [Oscillospiraceae bacterium]